MATHSFYMIIAACALAICGVSVGRVLISPLINFVQRQGKEIWVSETLALSAALGISVIVIFGLLLGYIGAFSLWSLLLLLFAALAASTYLYPKLMKHLTWGKVGQGDLAVLVICLALIGYAVFMRGHEIQGMRDQGVYTCTGIQLARTGTFIWHDRLITLLGFESVKHLFEDIGDILQGRPRFLRFAGYYLCPPQTGRVVPQFLHGYEVWVAVAYLVGGPQATQCLNGAFAALGVLLFYCVVRRVASPRTALISAFLLATSLPQLWYSRFPSNEPLLQVLVWATILGYVLLSVGQAPLSQRAQETRQFFLFPLAIPLAVATTVKFAFWPSLTIFAFEGGLRAHKRSSCLNAMLLWLIFVTVAIVAYLHAALFARYYLYGSWTFTIKRLGVSFELFPIVFVGAVAAAFSLGMILADYGDIFHKYWTRFRRGLSTALIAFMGVACLYQWHLFSSTTKLDVWGERTNLYEFAQYYGLPIFALALYGYWLWFSGREVLSDSRLVALLTIAATVFIIKRNLDALHPWASRRWLPVLVPSSAFAIALALSSFSATIPRWKNGIIVLGAAAIAFLQCWQAPVMVKVANYRGAIPQVDKWASILRADDFVLLQPSAVVAQYGPYLAARFDIQGYIQRNDPESWSKSRSVAAMAGQNFKRTIYVTDEDLSQSGRSCARLVATLRLDYPVVLETLHRLPAVPTRIRESIKFYEIDWASMPEGWWPQWTPKIEPRPPQHPPLSLSMGTEAEPYLVTGFFAPTEQPNAQPYRWTNGSARIAIGKLLSFPLNGETLRVKALIHSGRPSPIEVHWYLDLHDSSRAKKLGVTVARSEWSECQVEVPTIWLRPDSMLELQSLRPAVSSEIPPGVLGFRILELRIE